MPVLDRGLEAERIDREGAMLQTHAPDAAAEQRRQLLVAASEIEDDRDGVVLLGVRDDEIQQERLAAPRRAEDERVADVVAVQIPEVRRLMIGLEDRQTLAAAEVRAGAVPGVQGEQEAQVRDVGIEEREAPQIVRRIAGHDREPGVQEVVTLLVECSVVPGKGFHALRDAPIEPVRVAVVDHDRQRAVAEEMPAHLHLGQALPQLADGRARGVVDEHLLRPRLRAHVVDHRDALVEEVPPACVEVAAHRGVRPPLPLQAGDERARHAVEVLQHVRERLGRRLLHRQRLDAVAVDLEVVAVAVDGRVGRRRSRDACRASGARTRPCGARSSGVAEARGRPRPSARSVGATASAHCVVNACAFWWRCDSARASCSCMAAVIPRDGEHLSDGVATGDLREASESRQRARSVRPALVEDDEVQLELEERVGLRRESAPLGSSAPRRRRDGRDGRRRSAPLGA